MNQEVLTHDEKSEFAVNMGRMSDVLGAIDCLSVSQNADEKDLRMLLHSLPFFSEKLAEMSERLSDVTEIEKENA